MTHLKSIISLSIFIASTCNIFAQTDNNKPVADYWIEVIQMVSKRVVIMVTTPEGNSNWI